MEIKVSIEAEKLGKSLDNLSKELEQALYNAVDELAFAAKDRAIQLAQSKLKTTREDYINGLTLEKIDENIWLLSLQGDLPNAVEDGWPSFDQKSGLINGPKSKIGKNGSRYNTVPFQIRPYSETPLNQRSSNLRDIAKSIIKERKLDRIFKDTNTGLPKQGIVARVRNTGIKDLEGMVKVQKTYNKITQSQYFTFRRVSSNSDPSKWIHPGYNGARIFPMIEEFIKSELEHILSKLL